MEDLIRIRTQGFETLHPRVQQVVPVGAQDSLLKTVIARLGRREDFAAFQYPEFLLGCRGADYVSLPLHHPEFHIRNLEVMRELRANDILTTVCGKEDALPSRETIRATVGSIEESHGPVNGVFTLMMDDFDQSPNPFLVYHDDVSLKNSPEEEALFKHISHLLKKYRTELKVADVSMFPPQARGD